MVELGDQLERCFVALVKAGMRLLAAAGLCLYFTISFIEVASEMRPGGPLFWLCFGVALILGSLGCLAIARFVYDKWDGRNSPPDGIRGHDPG